MQESFALEKHTTVFQAEGYAILLYAHIEEVKATITLLFRSALNALDLFATTIKDNLNWIPEHRVIPGNEKVKLANGQRPQDSKSINWSPNLS